MVGSKIISAGVFVSLKVSPMFVLVKMEGSPISLLTKPYLSSSMIKLSHAHPGGPGGPEGPLGPCNPF